MRTRVVIAAIGAAIALAAPNTAAAATPSKTFSFTVTGAQLAVANLAPIPVPTSQLGVTPVSYVGTAEDDGSIAIPKAGITYPSINVPVPQSLIDQLAGLAGSAGSLPSIGGFDVSALLKNGSLAVTIAAGIKPTGPGQGTISRSTGQLKIRTALDVTIAVNAKILNLFSVPLISCGLEGVDFELTTDPVTLPGGSTLSATPYDSVSKTAVVADAAAIPAPKCTGLAASLIGNALDGLGSLGQLGLQLSGAVVLPPEAVATIGGSTSIKVSSTGSVSTKITCSKTRNCSGVAAVAFPGGAVLGSKAFKVSAGKSQTVSIKLGNAAKTAMKAAPQMDAVIRATVASGRDAVKPVTLKRPSNWR